MIDPQKIFTISGKRMFDRCPRSWAYRHILNLVPKELSKPLIRGNEFHEGAEGAYSGDSDKLSTSKQTAYARWVKKHEDLTILHTEVPVLVPLPALADYAGIPLPRIGPDRYVGAYYGGVIDGVINGNLAWWL